jgi:hypothetical protein
MLQFVLGTQAIILVFLNIVLGVEVLAITIIDS